ncbi:MAG: phosphatase family protein [Flavipsychrobacter sp.]|jgi:membrane-associated phospholipid phosphatase|nr:phosphatase family protein [Flavipsychrobacter sp.]
MLPLHKKFQILLNPFFIIPMLLWILAGGLTCYTCDQRMLFFAINTRYSYLGDVLMYYITMMGQGEVIIPVLLALMIAPKFRNWWYFITAVLCNALPAAVHNYIKGYLNHPRPRQVFRGDAAMHYLPNWPELLHSGFPSGHSQGAFSFFCFLSLLVMAKDRKLGLLFFFLAIMVGYSRIYLTAHFFGDVYAGSIFGVVATTLIFSIMSYYKEKFFKKKETSN